MHTLVCCYSHFVHGLLDVMIRNPEEFLHEQMHLLTMLKLSDYTKQVLLGFELEHNKVHKYP